MILKVHPLGLLRVSEYSDIRGSEYKIEYGYSSLPKSLDRDLFFFFFFTFFLTETRSFSQNNPLKFFTLTTALVVNIFYLNTFVSCSTVDNHVTCGQCANRMLQTILMENQYIFAC